MAQSVNALAVGASYGMVPAFLDKRGAIVSQMYSAVGDTAASMEFSVAGAGGTLVPEEAILMSQLRKCRMSVSPVRFMLTSEDLSFDDFVQLASNVQSTLSDLYKGVVMSYVGAVVRATCVSSKAATGNTKGLLEASIAGTVIPDVTEFRTTSLRLGQRKHLLVRPLRDAMVEVTLDLQKVKDATWDDLATLPKTARDMLIAFMAEMEQK